MNILLKSAKDLVSDSQLNGDLTVKGDQLTLLQHKQNPITNIHVWTSSFMIFMGVMLEKWPSKGQELFKYMYNVRLAASRLSGVGCSVYDKQFRLRKVRFPHSFSGDVDMELWLFYGSTPQKSMHPVASQPSASSSIHGSDHKLVPNLQKGKGVNFQKGCRTRACWDFNKGRCQFGGSCKFINKCSMCFGDHPLTNYNSRYNFSVIFIGVISYLCK